MRLLRRRRRNLRRAGALQLFQRLLVESRMAALGDTVLVRQHVRLGSDLRLLLHVGRQVEIRHLLVAHQIGRGRQHHALHAGKNLRREHQQNHHHQVDHHRDPEGLAHARALQIVLQLDQQVRGKIEHQRARRPSQRASWPSSPGGSGVGYFGGVRIDAIRLDQVRLELNHIRRP